jgi:hypothetical protein
VACTLQECYKIEPRVICLALQFSIPIVEHIDDESIALINVFFFFFFVAISVINVFGPPKFGTDHPATLAEFLRGTAGLQQRDQIWAKLSHFGRNTLRLKSAQKFTLRTQISSGPFFV